MEPVPAIVGGTKRQRIGWVRANAVEVDYVIIKRTGADESVKRGTDPFTLGGEVLPPGGQKCGADHPEAACARAERYLSVGVDERLCVDRSPVDIIDPLKKDERMDAR